MESTSLIIIPMIDDLSNLSAQYKQRGESQAYQVQQGWTAWKYILAHALYRHSHVNLKTVKS